MRRRVRGGSKQRCGPGWEGEGSSERVARGSVLRMRAICAASSS
jgi:hypothetical protein